MGDFYGLEAVDREAQRQKDAALAQPPAPTTQPNSVDQQYFPGLDERSAPPPRPSRSPSQEGEEPSSRRGEELNEVDSQYFGGALRSARRHSAEPPGGAAAQPRGLLEEGEEAGLVDRAFFGQPEHVRSPVPLKGKRARSREEPRAKARRGRQRLEESEAEDLDHLEAVMVPRRAEAPPEERPIMAFEVARQRRKELEESEAAEYDALREAAKTRAAEAGEEETGWGAGLRKLHSLIAPVWRMSPQELVLFLQSRVLLNDERMVALYKPYGLCSQPGKGVQLSLTDPKVLRALGKVLGCDRPLLPLQRLDKNTTGVVTFAKGSANKEEMVSLWLSGRVRKRYYAITNGVPRQDEGIVDIPLEERLIAGRYKMLPGKPLPEGRLPVDRDAVTRGRAVTEWKVLGASREAALVELTLRTGVRHQIRAHLGLGLSTPVLGDAKYSHYTQSKPQAVHGAILEAFGIRRSKGRHLPTFLHAHELLLPHPKEQRNVFINAPLPRFFTHALRKLRLPMP